MSQLAFEAIDHGCDRWVVWLHGFLGSSGDFRPIAKRLAPDYNALLVDLPGHGRSMHVDPASIEDAGDKVVDLIRRLGVPRPALVGYSLGGRVALSLAARWQGVVRALVLVSASPGIIGDNARAARRARDERVAEYLKTWPDDRFLDFWYRQSVFRSLQRMPAVLRAAAATRNLTDRSVAARAVVNYSPGQQKPVWDVLPALRSNLLYVAGECDGKYVATGIRVVTRSRRAHLAVISGSGHVVHLERPRAFARTLRTFLDRTH